MPASTLRTVLLSASALVVLAGCSMVHHRDDSSITPQQGRNRQAPPANNQQADAPPNGWPDPAHVGKPTPLSVTGVPGSGDGFSGDTQASRPPP